MAKMKKAAALALALALLLTAAPGFAWRAADENIPLFQDLLRLLKKTCDAPGTDRTAADAAVEAIRRQNGDDGDVAQAIADHWYANVMDSEYPMFVHTGGEKAAVLEASGLDFSGRHAFVVLGFRLENGEMTPELAGRCEAAAAAARSFPDAVLICTGGVTGEHNPEKHSEAGEMKQYLTEICGIDAGRIRTDPDAMTTAENAVNTFRILRELGIETYTVVTSDYHQLWAQILFNAVGAMTEKDTGHAVRILGNYSFPAQPDTPFIRGCKTGLNQLAQIIRNENGDRPANRPAP